MTALDLAALIWFLTVWTAYSLLVDHSPLGRRSLTGLMNGYRKLWMRTLLVRDVRIVDTSILTGLQNGAAFLASTSLLAIGGSLALISAADEALVLFENLPFGGGRITRPQWELRCLGLSTIFVYAFFKFAWALRLFNYSGILVGAVPPVGKGDPVEAEGLADRAGDLIAIAGKHFNNGQRAFFFSLGFLGWFVNPWLFMGSTVLVAGILARRQFFSDSFKAVKGEG